MKRSSENEAAETTVAGEAEPKGTPSSERYKGETAHHRETHAPPGRDDQSDREKTTRSPG